LAASVPVIPNPLAIMGLFVPAFALLNVTVPLVTVTVSPAITPLRVGEVATVAVLF
jgi:hypothetical protein